MGSWLSDHRALSAQLRVGQAAALPLLGPGAPAGPGPRSRRRRRAGREPGTGGAPEEVWEHYAQRVCSETAQRLFADLAAPDLSSPGAIEDAVAGLPSPLAAVKPAAGPR